MAVRVSYFNELDTYAQIECSALDLLATLINEPEIVGLCDIDLNQINVLQEKAGSAPKLLQGIEDYKCKQEKVYKVTRQQFHDYLEAEDVGTAVVKFKNGAVGTIEGTVNVYPKNLEETLYVFGENGTVKIGGTSTNNIDVWDFADASDADAGPTGMEEVTSNVYGNGHTSLFADMIVAIRDDCRPYVDAVAGRNAIKMILAMDFYLNLHTVVVRALSFLK